MATYYVTKTGLDTNAGTSAATAFLTIGKAASVVVAADTVYVGSGTYRESVTLTASGSAGNVINFIADTNGSKTGDPGEVIWSVYLTNDKTAPSSTSSCINLAGKAFYTFTGFSFMGGDAGNGGCFDGTGTPGAHDITFKNCLFNAVGTASFGGVAEFQNTAGLVVNLTIDGCIVVNSSQYAWLYIQLALNTANYDPNIVLRNNLIMAVDNQSFSITGVTVGTTGSGAGLPTGPHCFNNTFICPAALRYNNNLNTVTTSKVYNNIFICGNTAIYANAANEITEDFNLIIATTPRTNVAVGANSKTSYAALMELGQSVLRNVPAVPFGMPLVGSPLLAFGANAASPTIDALGFNRPGGSVGYLDNESLPVGQILAQQFPLKAGAFSPSNQGV